MTSVLSGAVFGAALQAAGVYQPAVILSQMKLENWHMVQNFLTATASSAVFVAILDRLGYMKAKPRRSTNLGLLFPYDGNVIGGALQGVGLALAGACPGTLLAQVANGTRSGLYALGGALLGGIVWTGGFNKLVTRNSEKASPPNPKLTIYERIGVSPSTGLLMLLAAFSGILYATVEFTPPSPYAVIPPILGGLFIGFAQLFSMLSRDCMLGVSSSYEEAGNYFWWWLLGGKKDGASGPGPTRNLQFAAGVVAGAWMLGQAFPVLAKVSTASISPLLAAIGGFSIVLGARIAGGCSSGHGISGISLLSTSSIITITANFLTGSIVTALIQ